MSIHSCAMCQYTKTILKITLILPKFFFCLRKKKISPSRAFFLLSSPLTSLLSAAQLAFHTIFHIRQLVIWTSRLLLLVDDEFEPTIKT